ncbi:MAG: replicative DNA helicase [Candidatus Omnitrophica bacterium]|nr:replicative DNA helicase [Candidatus Omnitrophota bacterium]MDD5080417.1 replicative DNA helicase [Candidatus Omnitrophota bacterium]MDD5441097.1 replicative DNA helicase [Candidatus Omnitrophota bacterium]
MADKAKIPPHNIDAEMATLGAMILNDDVIPEVLEHIKQEAFYRSEHQDIFGSIVALFDARKKVDILTISEDLEKRNLLKRSGGTSYLTTLTDFVPTSANVVHYAKIVKDKWVLRTLLSNVTEIASSVYEGSEDIDVILDKAEKLIFEIADSKVENSYVHIKEIIKKGIESIETLYHRKSHVTGVPTGFIDFDTKTSGLQSGDLIILAARPSMGKSALAASIAEHVAVEEKMPVLFLSLEMSKEQIMQRFLCSQARVDAHKLRTGFLAPSEWPTLTSAASRLSEAPIYIDDTPAMNIFDIRAKARRMKAHHDIKLIVVDYLQLIRGTRHSESRQQEISEISQSLKALAKELGIPVLALSQLSRAVESRPGHKPQLSDLRESGAIEQDADVVVLLFREEYYNPTPENKGVADVIIAKQRNGPVGTVMLGFIRQFVRFVNLAREQEQT